LKRDVTTCAQPNGDSVHLVIEPRGILELTPDVARVIAGQLTKAADVVSASPRPPLSLVAQPVH
jgi:hypothetical protein